MGEDYDARMEIPGWSTAHFDEAAPLLLADAAKTSLKPGEWFALEVIAEGNHLRVLIEDKTVVDYTDKNETFTVGRLGLVCRGNATVKFRKVEIKELPSSRMTLPPTFTTDFKRLQQILKNLLSNAFKFTAQGHVAMTVRSVTQGWSLDHPVLRFVQTAAAIAVTDTGIGIASCCLMKGVSV